MAFSTKGLEGPGDISVDGRRGNLLGYAPGGGAQMPKWEVGNPVAVAMAGLTKAWERYRETEDSVRANDFVLRQTKKLEDLYNNPDTGLFNTRKRGDAKGMYQDYQGLTRKIWEEDAKNELSESQRRLVSKPLAEVFIGWGRRVGSHETSESMNARIDTANNNVFMAQNLIAAGNVDFETLGNTMSRIRSSYADLGKMQGWDADTVERKSMEALGEAGGVGAIALAPRDPVMAAGALKQMLEWGFIIPETKRLALTEKLDEIADKKHVENMLNLRDRGDAVGEREYFKNVSPGSLPRGLRNNSPGNVKDINGNYIRYKTPVDGINASVGRVLRYQESEKFGKARTLRQIFHIYAPKSDNNDPDGYAVSVAKEMGIGPDQPIALRENPDMLVKLAKGIARQENGKGAYYTDDEYKQGVADALAGEKPKVVGVDFGGTDKGKHRPSIVGLIEAGNIGLTNRPVVRNDDGTISTVRSMSFHDGKNEVLVPTVSDDGKILSEEEAIAQYDKTGKHLGKFDTPAHATAYAQQLHKDQERLYADAGRGHGYEPGTGMLSPHRAAQYLAERDAWEKKQRAVQDELLGRNLAVDIRKKGKNPTDERERLVAEYGLERADDIWKSTNDEFNNMEQAEKARQTAQNSEILRRVDQSMQAEDFDQGARDEILRGIDDAQTYATARKRMDRALMARGLIPFRAEISNPAARVAAKAAAGNGMPLHEIELKYAADMNESDWAEVVKISGDEELKAANKKQNKFFNEMLLKSGMKEFSGGVWKFKSEADALYVAEVQAAYEDMMNAKEFKSVEQQREWVFEQLARRRDPTAWFFGKYPTAREARSIPGAHIPYFIPPSARSAVVSELRARGVDVTEANIRDMYMEAVRAGTPSLEADFDELQTGLSNLPEGVPF